jgi:hypothetical protein
VLLQRVVYGATLSIDPATLDPLVTALVDTVQAGGRQSIQVGRTTTTTVEHGSHLPLSLLYLFGFEGTEGVHYYIFLGLRTRRVLTTIFVWV